MMKVALLFLVRDRIPVEPIWLSFILAAAELQQETPSPNTDASIIHARLPAISANQTLLSKDCFEDDTLTGSSSSAIHNPHGVGDVSSDDSLGVNRTSPLQCVMSNAFYLY